MVEKPDRTGGDAALTTAAKIADAAGPGSAPRSGAARSNSSSNRDPHPLRSALRRLLRRPE